MSLLEDPSCRTDLLDELSSLLSTSYIPCNKGKDTQQLNDLLHS